MNGALITSALHGECMLCWACQIAAIVSFFFFADVLALKKKKEVTAVMDTEGGSHSDDVWMTFWRLFSFFLVTLGDSLRCLWYKWCIQGQSDLTQTISCLSPFFYFIAALSLSHYLFNFFHRFLTHSDSDIVQQPKFNTSFIVKYIILSSSELMRHSFIYFCMSLGRNLRRNAH